MTAADAADLRAITEADVYLGDEIVASLSRTPGEDILFDYTAAGADGRSVRDIARYRGHFS